VIICIIFFFKLIDKINVKISAIKIDL